MAALAYCHLAGGAAAPLGAAQHHTAFRPLHAAADVTGTKLLTAMQAGQEWAQRAQVPAGLVERWGGKACLGFSDPARGLSRCHYLHYAMHPLPLPPPYNHWQALVAELRAARGDLAAFEAAAKRAEGLLKESEALGVRMDADIEALLVRRQRRRQF